MTSPAACPKCAAEMVPGFLLEKSDGYRQCTEWVSGEPEDKAMGGVVVKGREVRPVRSFRCTGCGFLELYALSIPA